MANTQLGTVALDFANSNRAVADEGGPNAVLSNPNNYVSISALRARLAALNAGYYTSAKLDQMTVNDMVFAVRSIDDPTTISNYQPTSTA